MKQLFREGDQKGKRFQICSIFFTVVTLSISGTIAISRKR